MGKHWQYLKYVLRHKWYVLRAGMQIGKIPLWSLIIHDWQKFMPIEWSPYAWSFYGPWEYEDRPQWLIDAFDGAWLHHQHYGPHHWQYWVLREDSGDIKCLEMPSRYAREMLADWKGAGKAITGSDNTAEWYGNNKHKILLHPRTQEWIEGQLY